MVRYYYNYSVFCYVRFLGDWNGNLSELKKQFIDWPIKNLDEVIVITKDKKVIDLLP